MAGDKPVTLADLKREISPLLGLTQQQQQPRQPFRREPMKRRADDQPANKFKGKSEDDRKKKLLETEKEMRKLDVEREERSKRISKLEEKSEKRKKLAAKLEAKGQKAAEHNDTKAFAAAQKRQAVLQKGEADAERDRQKYRAAEKKDELDLAKLRKEQLRAKSTLARYDRRAQKITGAKAASSNAGSALQGMGGTVGGAAQGYAAYHATKGGPGGKAGALGAGLQAAGGMGGGLGDMLGAAGTGVQLGGIFGPWGAAIGAALGVAITGAKKLVGVAADTGDKILKLSGDYAKATNQIPDSADAAGKQLQKLGGEFAEAYTDAFTQNLKLGVSFDDTYDSIKRLSRAIRPVGEDAAKTLGTMSKDTQAFAASLDVSADVIEGAMTTNMLGLGKTAKQTSEDLGSMYSTVTAANKEFSDELGGTRLRMDAFTDIMFESARKGDLWSLNYKEVGKQLAYIGVQATKAGIAQERLQKLMKIETGILTDTNDQFMVHEQGAKELAASQKLIKGKTDKEAESALTERYGSAEIAKAAMRTLKEVEKQGGNAGGMQNIEFGQLTAGTATGTQSRLDAIRKQLGSVSEEGGGRTALVAQKYGLENNLPLARELTELLMKSADKAFTQRLEEAKKGQTPEERAGNPAGAELVNMAAVGANKSMQQARDSLGEFAAVTMEANAGMKLLVGSMKGVDAVINEARRRAGMTPISAAEQKAEIKARLTEGTLTGMGASPVVQALQRKQFEKENPNLSPQDFEKIYAEREKERASKAADLLGNARNKEDFMAKSSLQHELSYTPDQAKALLQARKTSASSMTPDEILKVINDNNAKTAAKAAEDAAKTGADNALKNPVMPTPTGMPTPGTAASLAAQSGPMSSMQPQQTPAPSTFVQTSDVTNMSILDDKNGEVTVEKRLVKIEDKRDFGKKAGQAMVDAAGSVLTQHSNP